MFNVCFGVNIGSDSILVKIAKSILLDRQRNQSHAASELVPRGFVVENVAIDFDCVAVAMRSSTETSHFLLAV